MNYRHAYHAGNFADVAKHLALVVTLLYLRKKENPFFVLDTHGGRGRYDLAAGEAARTGEAASGIGRLLPLTETAGLPDALTAYLALVSGEGAGHYPGSPLLAARLLRPQDRLVAVEQHPEDVAALKAVLASFRNAKVVEGDGYERLSALLPPKERRGLVLIDPPYEVADEFERAAAALAAAYRRFATGTYLLWFPIKSPAAADAFCGEALASGVAKALRVDVAVSASARVDKERLTAAGLLVVNPPFGLDVEVRAAAEILASALNARLEVRRLAGD